MQGWAWQSAKGVAATASRNRVWLEGGDLVHSETVKVDFAETHGREMAQDSYIETVGSAGSPAHFAMPSMLGSLLYGILGAQAISGSTDPYLHTATAALATPYATVWSSLGNGLFEQFVDCKLTHLKIHGDSNKPLIVTATWMGGIPAFLTAEEATAALEKSNRFLYYDGKATLLIEGVSTPLMKIFDLDLDRGDSIVPGDSVTPADVAEGAFTATLVTTTTPSDFAIYNRVHYGSAPPSNLAAPTTTPLELAGSPLGFDLKFTRVAASPGPERSVELLLPRVQLDPFADTPNVTPGPLTRAHTYKAYEPVGGGSPVTGKVKNADATIY